MSYKKVEFFSLKFNFLKRVEIKKGSQTNLTPLFLRETKLLYKN